ncbi:MAG TPA: chromate efflux transporter [Burkholderiales bacterium]|nr:chromate efflux transporter [Burkholderiales bacterium]
MQPISPHNAKHGASPLAIFWIFLKLGCTSFGGPIAHLGYLRHEFVDRRRWLDEAAYADLVALCQFLPGPASSQLGIALGIARGGVPGGIAAWLGFTLPSAVALIVFALSFERLGFSTDAGWLHGLKVVAVAVVAQAVMGMGKALCPDRFRVSLAVAATVIVFAWPTAAGQILAIAIGAVLGWRYLKPVNLEVAPSLSFPIGHRSAIAAWVVFFGLLMLLPVVARMTGDHTVAIFDSFYRSGSLVFGGGHVVLPLLRNEVVPPGWITDNAFLAGYGAAQAVPGPLFTFAAYLGTAMSLPPNGIWGGVLCLLAIFLPAFLLVVGALPYWDALRRRTIIQRALQGINASVVGILLAALYDPVWTSSIRTTGDFALALVAFTLLIFWKQSPLRVVIFTALGGAALAMF